MTQMRRLKLRGCLLFYKYNNNNKHMAICRSCQSYYKKNQWNQSDECSDCAYTADVPLFDEEDSLEVEHLLNPTGKTPARFNE